MIQYMEGFASPYYFRCFWLQCRNRAGHMLPYYLRPEDPLSHPIKHCKDSCIHAGIGCSSLILLYKGEPKQSILFAWLNLRDLNSPSFFAVIVVMKKAPPPCLTTFIFFRFFTIFFLDRLRIFFWKCHVFFCNMPIVLVKFLWCLRPIYGDKMPTRNVLIKVYSNILFNLIKNSFFKE